MSDLRQAAQQALEAWFRPNGINYVDFKPYMEAIRAALAEPAPPPECKTEAEKTAFAHGWWKALEAQRAALAEPEQARSLTDELMDCVDRLGSEADTVDPRVWHHLLVYAPKPEQEPVAWMLGDEVYRVKQCRFFSRNPGEEIPGQIPLYTAPTPRNEPVIDKTMAKRIATQLGWEPMRKPLTDEEMKEIWYAMQNIMGWYSFQEITRAVERAHGIGESK